MWIAYICMKPVLKAFFQVKFMFKLELVWKKKIENKSLYTMTTYVTLHSEYVDKYHIKR